MRMNNFLSQQIVYFYSAPEIDSGVAQSIYIYNIRHCLDNIITLGLLYLLFNDSKLLPILLFYKTVYVLMVSVSHFALQ